jgi:hypothetical protein
MFSQVLCCRRRNDRTAPWFGSCRAVCYAYGSVASCGCSIEGLIRFVTVVWIAVEDGGWPGDFDDQSFAIRLESGGVFRYRGRLKSSDRRSSSGKVQVHPLSTVQ